MDSQICCVSVGGGVLGSRPLAKLRDLLFIGKVPRFCISPHQLAVPSASTRATLSSQPASSVSFFVFILT